MSSDTPFFSPFSAPHVRSLKNASDVVLHVGEEQRRKFLKLPREFLRYGPNRDVPCCVMVKDNGTFRWLSNSSWPMVDTWMAFAGKVPLESNFATPANGSDRLEWLGIWTIGQDPQSFIGGAGVGGGDKVCEGGR